MTGPPAMPGAGFGKRGNGRRRPAEVAPRRVDTAFARSPERIAAGRRHRLRKLIVGMALAPPFDAPEFRRKLKLRSATDAVPAGSLPTFSFGAGLIEQGRAVLHGRFQTDNVIPQ